MTPLLLLLLADPISPIDPRLTIDEAFDFEPTPTPVDLLVVVAHPDDESTFGALIPHYALCRGKSVQFVSMTSGEWGNGLPHHAEGETPDYSYDDADVPRYEGVPEDATYPSWYREHELTRMLQTAGVRTRPLLPRFPDRSGLQPWGQPDAAFALWGGKERAVGYLVEQIRRLRPGVVVTMAYDGYNNNPQHMAAGHGTIAAVEAAADAASYPESAAAHGAWEVKKLYLAVTPERETYETVHRHDWVPCGPTDPRAIAAKANAMHASQQMPEECPESSEFVLRLSTVGPDEVGENDLFENVE